MDDAVKKDLGQTKQAESSTKLPGLPPKEVSFTVAAIPVAQPRQKHGARATRTGKVQSFNYIESEHPIHVFKMVCQQAAHEAMEGRPPLQGAVHLGVSFVLPRRKHPKKDGINRIPYPKKSDLDNFAKAVMDACSGILYDDDRQITSCYLTKEEAAQGENPHVLVLMQPVQWTPELPEA